MHFDINKFALFIGYARSGSSAVGAIVDAHPNAIISHELNVIKIIKNGKIKDKEALLNKIRNNAEKLNTAGRWSGGATGEVYSQSIVGQIKDENSVINIIGDKKSGGTTKYLSAHGCKGAQFQEDKIKRMISELQRLCGVPCKFIHVIRNPYDIVAAQIQSDISFNTKEFIRGIETVDMCRSLYKDNWLDVYHEDILKDSGGFITKLNDFLGLPQVVDHINVSKKHLEFKPKKRRFDIEWSEKTKGKIKDLVIGRFEFFNRYGFDDA